MKKEVSLLLTCLVIMTLLCSSAGAALIGSYTMIEPNIWAPADYWRVNMSIGQSVLDFDGRTSIFNGPDTSGWSDCANGIDLLNNIGRTFWIGSDQDDPDFSRFVSRFTDGGHDNVQAMFSDGWGGVGFTIPVHKVLQRPDLEIGSGYADVDLYGYSIDRIGITINSANYVLVDRDYNYAWNVTFTFEGEPVPEPASLVSLIVGACGFGMFRRRQH